MIFHCISDVSNHAFYPFQSDRCGNFRFFLGGDMFFKVSVLSHNKALNANLVVLEKRKAFQCLYVDQLKGKRCDKKYADCKYVGAIQHLQQGGLKRMPGNVERLQQYLAEKNMKIY